MKKLFGTDGIRGVANQYPMTAEVALAVGRSLSHVFKKAQRPRILIGKDTRLSCYMIETAMAAGMCSMGADVFLMGPMPTPGIAFLIQAMRADAGVVISASHNSFEDNGIKIFCRHGFKLPDYLEEKIENLVISGEIDHFRPTAGDVGRVARIDDARGRYIEFLKSTFPKNLSLEGLKIVVDCANGATYKIAPIVLEELGAEVIIMGDRPNGRNINKGVGAVYPEHMAKRVIEEKAQVGIALDGDGDRVIFADEKGSVVDGDATLAICAEELIRKGVLKEKTVVATVMSNQGLDEYLAPSGGKVIRAQVGDRYVVEAMREKGCNFGGEASGHLVFLDHSTTGDGLIAALQVFSLMVSRESTLSKIVSKYEAYPQVLKNIKVRERKDLELFPDLQTMIRSFEKSLGTQGRLLIRYSGTEPVVRIMAEGKEELIIKKMVQDLCSCIERNLA